MSILSKWLRKNTLQGAVKDLLRTLQDIVAVLRQISGLLEVFQDRGAHDEKLMAMTTEVAELRGEMQLYLEEGERERRTARRAEERTRGQLKKAGLAGEDGEVDEEEGEDQFLLGVPGEGEPPGEETPDDAGNLRNQAVRLRHGVET